MLEETHLLENEATLATYFLLKEIDRVAVSFDGSGDSGQIDEVELFSKDQPFDPKEDQVVVWAPGDNLFQTNEGWTRKPATKVSLGVSKALEDHVGLLLDQTNVDWYNNDGGWGSWEWSAGIGVNFQVHVRETTSSLEHCRMYQLGSSESEGPMGDDE